MYNITVKGGKNLDKLGRLVYSESPISEGCEVENIIVDGTLPDCCLGDGEIIITSHANPITASCPFSTSVRLTQRDVFGIPRDISEIQKLRGITQVLCKNGCHIISYTGSFNFQRSGMMVKVYEKIADGK